MINRTLQRVQFNRRMRARIRLLAAVLFAGVLTACGGGDPEDEERASIEPVPCAERPELCR